MRLVIDARQMLEVKMGVDLRGAEIGVPKELLNRAKISARFQKMTGKRMPEHVRMKGLRNTLPLLPSNQTRLDTSGRDPYPPATQENRGLLRSRQDLSQREPALKSG